MATHRLRNCWKPWNYSNEIIAFGLPKWPQQVSPSSSTSAAQEAESGPLWPQIIPLPLMHGSSQHQAPAVSCCSWYDDKKHSLVSLGLPLPEPFQLSTTALILSSFPPSGPWFLEAEIFPAEITGGFCSTGNVNLLAGWQEGEVAEKVR